MNRKKLINWRKNIGSQLGKFIKIDKEFLDYLDLIINDFKEIKKCSTCSNWKVDRVPRFGICSLRGHFLISEDSCPNHISIFKPN